MRDSIFTRYPSSLRSHWLFSAHRVSRHPARDVTTKQCTVERLRTLQTHAAKMQAPRGVGRVKSLHAIHQQATVPYRSRDTGDVPPVAREDACGQGERLAVTRLLGCKLARHWAAKSLCRCGRSVRWGRDGIWQGPSDMKHELSGEAGEQMWNRRRA